MCDLVFVQPESPYFKDSKMECAIFVAWNLIKLCIKLELHLILFHEQVLLNCGVQNKDPIVWLIWASLPRPVSCPPLARSHPHTVLHTCHSRSFKLSIFKHNSSWENDTPYIGILEVRGFRLQKYPVTHISLQQVERLMLHHWML
jgi:hypothetical protein